MATLDLPLGLAIRAADDALYIVGKNGAVWALRDGRVDPTPRLDLTGQVARGSEQGLLGLVFSPSGRFAYVNYTDRKGDTNVVECEWRNGRGDLSSRRLVLFVRQPFQNHNGGNLVFGPDGYLYIGLGDGGSGSPGGDPRGDPQRNGQNLGVLLGKMLRIEPRTPDGSIPTGGAVGRQRIVTRPRTWFLQRTSTATTGGLRDHRWLRIPGKLDARSHWLVRVR